MATITDFACVQFAGYSESFDPSVLVSDMERGIPKQRIQNSQVVMKISASLMFLSDADIAGFETWYFDEIKRIGWFSVVHPRTGVVTSMRFDGGSIGTLAPQAPSFAVAQRDVVLEYMR